MEYKLSHSFILHRGRAAGGAACSRVGGRSFTARLRFAVPSAADLASSLAWAGSSLCPLIYPGLFSQQLQDLWTSLAAPAINTIPPRSARVQVIVDAGILRREDCSPERMVLELILVMVPCVKESDVWREESESTRLYQHMAHMRGALVTRMLDAWPAYYHVGMGLHLPEPVPGKMRIAEDEEEEKCCVCFELL
ncbi:hypothetical protein BAE44_0023996 [Dichanthelium oligosanthes]|uniref:Uncharacterized protein n=1 Tax=Dichanthelium oligosanthes TaxID=888268 RepID=A0A1E5UQ48_9POAL|nr:hypothetical protein BAE44_0023996 [Dichanthelium oligosanthes]